MATGLSASLLIWVRSRLRLLKAEAHTLLSSTPCSLVCWLLMLLYPGVCKKVMQLYGTRSLDTGAFLRADYAVQTRDLAFQRLSKYSNYATGGAFMCILYPAGIPLLFMLSMRHERRAAEAKGNNFLDSYIGFVAAGYRVKVSIPVASAPAQAARID